MTSAIKPRVIHGGPITPVRLLAQLAGESFCVSFARPDQLEQMLELQDKNGMLLLDNGAFSHWRAGKGQIDPQQFFAWANAIQARCEVAVAVIPDVIEGSEAQNWHQAALAVRELSEYSERLMFVWHMNDSLETLKNAARLFNFVAIGSCAEYDIQRQRKAFLARLREASAVLDYVEREFGRRPWVHLMRGLSVIAEAIRFESADSSNIARNHCRTKLTTERHVAKMANKIRGQVARAAAGAKFGITHSTSNFSDAGVGRQLGALAGASYPDQLSEAA